MAITTLSSGTSRTALPVSAGSELDVLSGGLSIATGIAGVEMLLGGTDSSGSVNPGGVQGVASGGKALGDFVNAGGTQTVSSGGLASGNTIVGSETVLAGGAISGNTVQNGPNVFGLATITVSGSATSTTVSSGGSLIVASGGITTVTTVLGNGQQTISAGGSGTADTVGSGGMLTVLAGAVETSGAVAGTEMVYGTDSAVKVSGTQIVEAGGVAIGGSLAAGGMLVAGSGAVVSAATASGSMVIAGGEAIGITVAAGGSVTILSGGSTIGTNVLGQGSELISGGLTTGSVIESGGSQTIASGGALNDVVADGGVVIDNAILGFAEDAAVTSTFSGTLSGSGNVVQYGQGTAVLAGPARAFTGTMVISGGTLELASATGANAFDFISGAFGLSLQIDGDAPGGTISGFGAGDTIDLAALPYPTSGLDLAVNGDSVSFTSNGTAVHFADGSVAGLTIAGAGALNLVASSDGSSGTLISALGSPGGLPSSVAYQITAYANGYWDYYEAAGAVANLSDGNYYNSLSNLDAYPYTAVPSPFPTGEIIQSGPGTLNLVGSRTDPSSSAASFGSVVIAGGTVQTVAPAPDGVTSFSFASGTTGTLLITGIKNLYPQGIYGGPPQYFSGFFNPVTAIAPGDVIDISFLSYSTAGLGVTTTGDSVELTSNNVPIVFSQTVYYQYIGPSQVTTTALIPISSADQYTYTLSDDGNGGTDLTVTGYASGLVSGATNAGAPFNSAGNSTVNNGGIAYTITGKVDGSIVIAEPHGATFSSFTSLSGASLVQAGPGRLYISGTILKAPSFGSVVISGGVLELAGYQPVGAATIVFGSGAPAALVIDGATPNGDRQVPSVAISGLSAGDVIDLPAATYTTDLRLTVTSNTVTVTSNGQPADFVGYGGGGTSGPITLNIADASSYAFSLNTPLTGDLANDGLTGLTITVACYCPGTHILTNHGERAIEGLSIGDRVVTTSGDHEPIKWIGRRSYAGRFLAGRRELLPVVITAGALGGGVPRRDLRVSPSHAMLLDGALVPARHLVNGTTIFYDTACTRVDYIHIELAQHGTIWAEGAASETYVDDDNRFMFHNANEYVALYPMAGNELPRYCAPRLESGYALDAIRERLAAFVGHTAGRELG